MHFKMSSAICFNLDQSKILSFGRGLSFLFFIFNLPFIIYLNLFHTSFYPHSDTGKQSAQPPVILEAAVEIKPPSKLPPLSLDAAWQTPSLDTAWKSGIVNCHVKSLCTWNVQLYTMTVIRCS